MRGWLRGYSSNPAFHELKPPRTLDGLLSEFSVLPSKTYIVRCCMMIVILSQMGEHVFAVYYHFAIQMLQMLYQLIQSGQNVPILRIMFIYLRHIVVLY